jgi:hypothetical protein
METRGGATGGAGAGFHLFAISNNIFSLIKRNRNASKIPDAMPIPNLNSQPAPEKW